MRIPQPSAAVGLASYLGLAFVFSAGALPASEVATVPAPASPAKVALWAVSPLERVWSETAVPAGGAPAVAVEGARGEVLAPHRLGDFLNGDHLPLYSGFRFCRKAATPSR